MKRDEQRERDDAEAQAHARAEALIAKDRVEGISASEQEWLGSHLRDCEHCAGAANATARALRSLRAMSIAMPRDLARRTQFRVQLRALELRAIEPRWRLVWLASAISWVLGAATAPMCGTRWNGSERVRECQSWCGRWALECGGRCPRSWPA